MLGRLARLGLDQDRALEADLVLVLDDQVEEAAELVEFLTHARVEQGLVAFAAAPQHIVLAAKCQCGVHRVAHLQGRHREDRRIGIGGRARHEATVAEQIGRAPQQFHAGALLVLAQHIDHPLEVVVTLARRCALRSHVAVMEAVVRGAKLGEHLKGGFGLHLRQLQRRAALKPGALESATAKRVEAVPAEGVPVADREAQMVFHAFAQHDAVAVVVAEGEWVCALGALEFDLGDMVEVAGHGVRVIQALAQAKARARCWRGADNGADTGLGKRALAMLLTALSTARRKIAATGRSQTALAHVFAQGWNMGIAAMPMNSG